MSWLSGLTIEQALAYLRHLKAGSERSDHQTMLACIELEASELWLKARSPRDTSFAVFLQNSQVCIASWYLSRRAVYDLPDLVPHIEVVGLSGLVKAAEVHDTEQRERIVRSLISSAKARGEPLPGRTATNIVDRIVGGKDRKPSKLDEAVAKNIDLEEKVACLGKEKRDLLKEVMRLKAENQQLSAECERLRAVVRDLENSNNGARSVCDKLLELCGVLGGP